MLKWYHDLEELVIWHLEAQDARDWHTAGYRYDYWVESGRFNFDNNGRCVQYDNASKELVATDNKAEDEMRAYLGYPPPYWRTDFELELCNDDEECYNDEYVECNCYKCEILEELFNNTEKSNRDYWLMTELFYMLHDDSDICKGE